jgi:glycosyltransferase involved in cell wall biosynthesis
MNHIDVLATNIQGMGATQLVASLLPALERVGNGRIGTVWLPEQGPLSTYRGTAAAYRTYRRWLPNAVSRLLECTLLAGKFGRGPALVLGDLPVAGMRDQVVLAHSPFLARRRTNWARGWLKAYISRWIFKSNLRHVRSVVVQTEPMRQAIADTYFSTELSLVIIPQPPPQWLLNSELKRSGPAESVIGRGLKLFFPSAGYPHKNHAILERLEAEGVEPELIGRIDVTIEQGRQATRSSPLLRWLGPLGPSEMVSTYAQADALIFPSLQESYGLPLVEAMYLGLPILCADLPYARALCDDGAIYFDPHSIRSIRQATQLLRDKLLAGWWPDWTRQLARIPDDWDEVARRMLALLDG